jgi:hypothetical protein
MRKHWPGGVCSETVCRNPLALEEDHIETLNGDLTTCMKKVVIQAVQAQQWCRLRVLCLQTSDGGFLGRARLICRSDQPFSLSRVRCLLFPFRQSSLSPHKLYYTMRVRLMRSSCPAAGSNLADRPCCFERGLLCRSTQPNCGTSSNLASKRPVVESDTTQIFSRPYLHATLTTR